MKPPKAPKEPNEFGRRLLIACEQEGRSQTSAERDAGIPRGYLSRMLYGDRGETSMNAGHVAALAKLLHVNFEWLAIGEGPMRREGRGTTPAEQAITFARSTGAREDAIKAAWERNKDREAEMDAWAWARAIDEEARRLDRSNVPRPEAVHEKKAAIQRQSKRRRKLEAEVKENAQHENQSSHEPHPRRRASGGV